MRALECPRRPLLVFACGNASQGDDALGPLLIESLEGRQQTGELGQVELLSDFQLQVEHILDLRGRELVVFVDAAASGPEPFSYHPVCAERDASYTTHSMSPGALLRVFEQVIEEDSPSTWLLAIRGYAFDLGGSLSVAAEANLSLAIAYVSRLLLGWERKVAGIPFMENVP